MQLTANFKCIRVSSKENNSPAIPCDHRAQNKRKLVAICAGDTTLCQEF